MLLRLFLDLDDNCCDFFDFDLRVDDDGLDAARFLYRAELASKQLYEEAIRSHQKAKKEASSDERKLAKKSRVGRDLSVLSESELAGLCGVRKSESALFRPNIGLRTLVGRVKL